MREEDVPQDESFYDGHLRACYAVDRRGRYVLARSRGWRVETLATEAARAEFRETLERTRRDVVEGRVSPLAFHMAARQLTPALLAAGAGLFRWRVRRHLRPDVFVRLPDRLLNRYAECLDVSLDQIRRLPDCGCD